MPSAGQWIKVAEKLPEQGFYLTFFHGTIHHTQYWKNNRGELRWFAVGEDKDVTEWVTHWMEMPEPPSVGQTEHSPYYADGCMKGFPKAYCPEHGSLGKSSAASEGEENG